jgi:magnesium-transporting ATPase (P-type)
VPNFLNVRFYCVATSGEDGVALRPKTVVKTDPELVALLKEGGGGASADRARDFLLTLATCNTIVPIVVDDDDNDSAAAAARLLEYQGESPDEQALVYAAAAYGYTLVERTSGHVTVDVLGSRQRYVRACCSSPYRFSCLASVRCLPLRCCFMVNCLFPFESCIYNWAARWDSIIDRDT